MSSTFPSRCAYLGHPAHVQLVETWKPELEWLRVDDIHDATP